MIDPPSRARLACQPKRLGAKAGASGESRTPTECALNAVPLPVGVRTRMTSYRPPSPCGLPPSPRLRRTSRAAAFACRLAEPQRPQARRLEDQAGFEPAMGWRQRIKNPLRSAATVTGPNDARPAFAPPPSLFELRRTRRASAVAKAAADKSARHLRAWSHNAAGREGWRRRQDSNLRGTGCSRLPRPLGHVVVSGPPSRCCPSGLSLIGRALCC